MHRHFAPLAVALALTTALPALAHTTVYRATLSGAGETPVVVTTGTGTAKVIVDSDDFTMRVKVSFADLVGTTTIAHIHCCTLTAGSGTAGAATTTPTFVGFPAGVKAGRFDKTFDMAQAGSWGAGFLSANGGNTATAFAALTTGLDAGKAYFNVHTTFKGGGEIAGFLTPVPEPGTYAMMAAGLLAVGAVARRRRG